MRRPWTSRTRRVRRLGRVLAPSLGLDRRLFQPLLESSHKSISSSLQTAQDPILPTSRFLFAPRVRACPRAPISPPRPSQARSLETVQAIRPPPPSLRRQPLLREQYTL